MSAELKVDDAPKEKITLTKQDLVETIAAKLDVNKSDASTWVELLFETMKAILASGEQIKISGFGNFNVRAKSSRQGRNPRTGEAMEITARKVVTYHCSEKLKEELNPNWNPKEA